MNVEARKLNALLRLSRCERFLAVVLETFRSFESDKPALGRRRCAGSTLILKRANAAADKGAGHEGFRCRKAIGSALGRFKSRLGDFARRLARISRWCEGLSRPPAFQYSPAMRFTEHRPPVGWIHFPGLFLVGPSLSQANG
ncbi:hypothetical protein DB347_19790 [Opitutaceae bacterium EW11]|nr:hypothetical protein DB347_19790 [Opitutaceae bacterium EW11]